MTYGAVFGSLFSCSYDLFMVQWKERGNEGLDRAEFAEPWSRIMSDVEVGHRRVQISVGTGEGIPTFKEASMLYVQEVVGHLEG
jgi:hypothetical protein